MSQKHEEQDTFARFMAAARTVQPVLPGDVTDRIMDNLPRHRMARRHIRLQRRFALGVAVAAGLALLVIAGLPLVRHSVATGTERTVVFRIEAPGAKTIRLVGDFNGWQGEVMRQEDGAWLIRKQLPRGHVYKYAFVVDNEVINDIRADRYIEDGFGGKTAAVYTD